MLLDAVSVKGDNLCIRSRLLVGFIQGIEVDSLGIRVIDWPVGRCRSIHHTHEKEYQACDRKTTNQPNRYVGFR